MRNSELPSMKREKNWEVVRKGNKPVIVEEIWSKPETRLRPPAIGAIEVAPPSAKSEKLIWEGD